jgi:UDP-GlcNAc:undecaprenyl-phosphate GlcNAc-1-phosphate transferase
MADAAHSFDYVTVLQPYMPVFYVSFLVTLVLTPLMRRLAHRHGVVDDPDNKRKVHTQPIAYLGGVSIFLGWIAGVTVAVFLRPHFADAGSTASVQIPVSILLGAATVAFFGLMDDVYSLSPKMKLLGQFAAAFFLILPGILPASGAMGADFLMGKDHGPGAMVFKTLFEMRVFSEAVMQSSWMGLLVPLFSGAVVLVIIVSTCNSTNLLDGLDGLCSGVTGVMSAGYLILAMYLAFSGSQDPMLDPVRITLSLALLGAVLGFLPYNFNPASIFMGDTGSMFLGYMCGTMILLFGQHHAFRFFLAAIIMFGLPMMDTLLAIVRRKLNGKPIFSPDSNHFHHFLIRRGYTVRGAVMLSYGVAALFVSFGLVIMFIPTRLALGVYLVLFGWIIVAAFKMGMIFQGGPTVTANTSLNLSVITPGANGNKKDHEEKENEKEDEKDSAGVA